MTTDEQIESALRSAYATVVETSPVPLEWDEVGNHPVPLAPPRRTSQLRQPVVVFLAAAVLVLAAAVAATLVGTSDTVELGSESSEWKAVLFLSGEATRVEIDAVAAELERLDGVTDWVYVDSEMALAEALALFSDDKRMIDVILEDPSILPSTLRFATVDEESARAVVRMAATLVNQGTTAIVDGIVHDRGPLVATGPDHSSNPGPSQGDFVVTTTIPPAP
jgi:hypothetical protein